MTDSKIEAAKNLLARGVPDRITKEVA